MARRVDEILADKHTENRDTGQVAEKDGEEGEGEEGEALAADKEGGH